MKTMTEQVTIRKTEKGKFALQHSTVTALIVGGFIIGSEILESLIPASGTVLSLFVATAILVMLRPMQRLALRMADRLLHSVQSTPAYPEIPKLEVYRAALEEVLQDGIVTDKERRILGRLVDNLGISPRNALALENELKQ
jgi:hypothetical protein